jgi:hypothetical protein
LICVFHKFADYIHQMKNLFDTATYNEVLERLDGLELQAPRGWGKMDVAQMLAHLSEAFKVPLSKTRIPRMFIGRLFGWMFKAKLYNDAPWKRNLPTAPNFVVKDSRVFESEKAQLRLLIESFYKAGPGGISKFPHPLFGKFTPEQWGKSMYKHLDHHLQQFGR